LKKWANLSRTSLDTPTRRQRDNSVSGVPQGYSFSTRFPLLVADALSDEAGQDPSVSAGCQIAQVEVTVNQANPVCLSACRC